MGYHEHKVACKEIARARQEFKESFQESKEEARAIRRTGSRKQLRWETLATFLNQETGLIWGGASFLRKAVDDAAEASESSDALSAIKGLANNRYGYDEESEPYAKILGELSVTSSNLVRLVASVLHFYESPPDMAEFCAAGVDLFFEVSMLRPLVPRCRAPGDDKDLPEACRESIRQIKKMRQEKKTKKKGKNKGRPK